MSSDDFRKSRRFLPHWEKDNSTYFVTFNLLRGILTPEEKGILMATVQFGDAIYFDLHAGVVMPDHAHLLFRPREEEPGQYYTLARIMKGIKGTSSREINKVRGTRGMLWQDESLDRIIRSQRELEQTWRYIYENPVAAGLVERSDDYPFHIPCKRLGDI